MRGTALLIADGAQVHRLTPDASAPPTATVFAAGVPGTNGLAFDDDGDLLVADTARGVLWKVELDHRGSLRSRTGCDSTLAANTLCLEALWDQPLMIPGRRLPVE